MKKLLILLTVLTVACTQEPPTASFETDKSNAYIDEAIQFNNSSTESVSSLWDFGDNTSSTEINPSHKYQTAGTKTIVLTCTNKGGDDMFMSKVNIHNGTASYQVKNASTISLELMSYYWDGEEVTELVSHGTMATGKLSDTIYTSRDVINLAGKLNGELFLVVDDYNIVKQKNNILEINDNSNIYSSKSANIKAGNKQLERLKLFLENN